MDKYFGFLRIQDEYSLIESLLERAMADHEQLKVVAVMVTALMEGRLDTIETDYVQVRDIHNQATKAYDSVAEQLIHAKFDTQKQYDLLRLYQRMCDISGLTIATAKRLAIVGRIGAVFPVELTEEMGELVRLVVKIQMLFHETLKLYQHSKEDVIDRISGIEEVERQVDHFRSICLEKLYRLANEGLIPTGSLRAFENVIEHLESLTDTIEESAKSLEWLLLR